jgi:hypothetical protein
MLCSQHQMANCGACAVILCMTKEVYPYSRTFEAWEKHLTGLSVYFKGGRFYIKGTAWTRQVIEYQPETTIN